MRAPILFVAVSMASVLAACSKPKPQPDAALARDLDLALSTGARSVVSAVELGAVPKPQAKAPAAPVKEPGAAHVSHPMHRSVKETAPVPQPAEVKPAPKEETPAAAPAPVPVPTVVAQAPEPAPAPAASPEPERGNGGRGFPGGNGGGFRIPGIGGVIIIRGGGNGTDPCDERGEHHRGRGGMGGMMGGGGMGGGIYLPMTGSRGGIRF